VRKIPLVTSLKQTETAVIFVAQDGNKIVGCKDKELAVKYFHERYGVWPHHVIQCPYYLTDQLMVKKDDSNPPKPVN
jgi:hypothetical protein